MDDRLKQAYEFYKNGYGKEAVTILSKLVQQEPNNEKAWYSLGVCIEETQKKVYCFKRTLSIDPNHQYARLALEKLTSPTKQIFQETSAIEINSQNNGKPHLQEPITVPRANKVQAQQTSSNSSNKKELVVQMANIEVKISQAQENISAFKRQIEEANEVRGKSGLLILIGLFLAPVGIGIFILIIAFVGMITAPGTVRKLEGQRDEWLVNLNHLRKELVYLRGELADM